MSTFYDQIRLNNAAHNQIIDPFSGQRILSGGLQTRARVFGSATIVDGGLYGANIYGHAFGGPETTAFWGPSSADNGKWPVALLYDLTVKSHGTLTNTNTINYYRIGLTIDAGGTVVNSGLLESYVYDAGVLINNVGGTILNGSQGITGDGRAFSSYLYGGGTIINHGLIAGTLFSNFGRMTNDGTISADFHTSGIVSNSGLISGHLSVNVNTLTNSGRITNGVSITNSIVTNSAGGVITGNSTFSAGGMNIGNTFIQGTSSLINQGTLGGTSTFGIGGLVSNRSGGLINGTVVLTGTGTTLASDSGSRIDGFVTAKGDQETVTLHGTLNDQFFTTVRLNGTNNRLIIGQDAVGNGVFVDTTTSAALELAGGGSTPGNLNNFFATWSHFGGISVDAGTNWIASSSRSPGSYNFTSTFTVSGTLTNNETLTALNTVNAGGTLINNNTVATALVVNAGGTFINNKVSALVLGRGAGGDIVTNTAGATISAASSAGVIFVGTVASTLINAGTISSGTGTAVQFSSGHDRLVLGAGAQFVGAVKGVAGTNVLELSNANGAGSVALSGASFVNFGTIVVDAGATWTNTGSIAAGVSLVNNGVLINAGVIDPGVIRSGPGAYVAGGTLNSTYLLHAGRTLVNLGSINATGGGVYADGANVSVDNSGRIQGVANYYDTYPTGVFLKFGGNVTNRAGALVNGYVGVQFGAAGTLSNSGTITGAVAVSFASAGGRVIVAPGAVFGGQVRGNSSTLELASAAAAGTINNLGSSFTGFTNVTVDAGASWNLAGAATLASSTLTNGGSLSGNLTLAAGGRLTNTSAGQFSGQVVGAAAGVSVSNAGSITNGGGVFIGGANGVSLGAAGTVTNLLGGVIKNTNALLVSGGAGTLTNSGYMYGFYFGARLSNGGMVTNNAGATIVGKLGVYISGSASGTVVNSGTIIGSTSVANGLGAVQFGTGTDRLIFNPGAVFVGTVRGGGANSTLELASAASAGTLTNLGNSFTGFGNVTIDAGANWNLGGTASLAAGAVLTNSGTLSGTATLASGGSLVNTAGAVFAGTARATTGSVSVQNAGAISGAYYGLVLSAGGNVTNLGGATISNNDAVLIGGAAGTVTNSGSIGALYFGVRLTSGGTITNNAGATISGKAAVSAYGGSGSTVINAGVIDAGTLTAVQLGSGTTRLIVKAGAAFVGTVQGGGVNSTLELASSAAAGTISNLGSSFTGFGAVAVDAGAAWRFNGATLAGGAGLVNAGTITGGSYAAQFTAGGSLTNAATGTIASYSGVRFTGAAGTVVNSGKIADTQFAVQLGAGGVVVNNAGGVISSGFKYGVTIAGGGTVTNAGTIAGGNGKAAVKFDASTSRLIVQAGASFTGAVQGGGANSTLELASSAAAGTVTSLGSSFTGFGQVAVDAGASWTLGGSATVASGTLINAGTLAGDVTLAAGGVFSNAAGAQSTTHVYSTVAGAGVVNAGTLGGGGLGVVLRGGGSFTNAVGGSINNYYAVIVGSPTIANSAGTVVNSGTIAGIAGGVVLVSGGTVTNNAGATITAGSAGNAKAAVYGAGSAATTVVNAGTISGTGGRAAVQFGSGADRLIVKAGAAFVGAVRGGGANSTLELSTGTGTLTGLGSSFTNFGAIAVDASTRWTLTGANTAASGTVITNSGSLTLLNATLTGGAALVNNGAILIDPSSVTVSSLGGTGSVTIDTGSTLSVTGSIASGETIVFTGTGGVLALGDPGHAAGTISGFAATDTIDFTSIGFALGGTVSLNSATDVLTITENGTSFSEQLTGDYTGKYFHLKSDGAGGTALSVSAAPDPTVTEALAQDTGFSSSDRVTKNPALTGMATPGGTITVRNGAVVLGTVAVTAANIVANPDFGPANAGSGYGTIMGWTETSSTAEGSNTTSQPFWNNGTVPAGTTTVGFVQGVNNALSQSLTLTVGVTYVLTYLENARSFSGGIPIVEALVGGQVVVAPHQDAPVGGAAAFRTQTATFVATAATETLTFLTTSAANATTDVTALYTNVSVTPLLAAWSFTPTLGDGAYTLTASETDVAGNIGSTTLSFTLDRTAPTILSSTAISAARTYTPGQTIDFSLTMSEAVGVTGTPTLTLNDGGTAAYDAARSTATNLLFSTTVANGQAASPLAVTGLALAGGTIRDTAGNDAVLTNAPASFSGLSVACYAAGTPIATRDGEAAIETLRPGDHVRLADGGSQPVIWVGERRIDCTSYPEPEKVWPVCVAANAFAPGVPHAGVRMSPEHAVFADGILIPVRTLVNGTTIVQERVDHVHYLHVELERHALLLAAGLPAESWLDCGNRGMFSNAPAVPGATTSPEPDPVALGCCAPRDCGGPIVEAVRERLRLHAETMGYTYTFQADLQVLADGLPISQEEAGIGFVLPSGVREIRVRSRSGVPAEHYAASYDRRRLGLLVGGIKLHSATAIRHVQLDDEALGEGFEGIERHADHVARWTTGDAVLRSSAWHGMEGALRLELDVLRVHPSWDRAVEAPGRSV